MRSTLPGAGRGFRTLSLTGSFAMFALIVLTALGLVSCTTASEDPTPSPSRPTTETPTATPTPSPSRIAPPDRPEAMARDDLAGAMAAAQYFLELYPYAYNTGDLTEWRAMSHPDCIFCASVIENVEKLHSEGGYETGGEIVVENVIASEPVSGTNLFGVDLVLIQGAASEHDPNGSITREIEPAKFVMYTALLHAAGNWILREVTPERQS